MSSKRKLVLAVIDGLTPSMLEGAMADGSAPRLAELAAAGAYGRAISTFPSLTPVCLSSIATGAHSDVHEIPHLVWWHRNERRLVEYGSSFGAARAAGLTQTLRDTLVGLNADHLGRSAVTLFEALADAGLRTAAVNFTAYRGRTSHRSLLPWLGTVQGPEGFFLYNLFASDRTGAPLSFRNRPAGSIDAYAVAVGRWLVTRDAFDFLLYYLSDYDYASHASGPDTAVDVLTRCDAAVGALLDAAGGMERFLERYAIVVLADHGQTRVDRTATLRDHFRHDDGILVTAANRAAQIYRLDAKAPAVRTVAERLDAEPGAELVAFLEDGEAVARRGGEELRIGHTGSEFEPFGDARIVDHPDGVARLWAALHCPNAGEVLVSATEGWEFSDMAGRHHRGGGSHGSLVRGDSEVPMITVGLDRLPRSIVDVAPLVLAHFGVDVPAYALDRAA
ncbi:MAG: alkaline phosphatase family protein [Gaiella sp.]